MTPLGERLAARIAAHGPVTLADYMATALMDPEHGYYATRDPFGQAGDFITAPEISQMFGELVGLWLAQVWQDQGAPAGVVLAEAGPGRGTLMADVLRATRAVPGFRDAVAVHLVETSATLREAQAQRLPGATWHDDIGTLPEGPLLLVANEFLDALPVRQFVRRPEGWAERVVTVQGGRLALALAATAPPPAVMTRDVPPGTVIEHCPALPGIVGAIGARIARHGGAALFIDYGEDGGTGDTLQALRAHRPVDPLAEPGLADLTAHVDFAAIARAAPPARASAVVPQGAFLERLGITARARTLAAGLSGAALDDHVAAHRRLTHPGEMGRLFKVIGLAPPDAPPLPGLEP
ncbi:MAG: SAM-dependent methyltransferase [Rubellimicrobium sp.]|nr:SAM-dependent methyltransferase [Rubellimicrobium sp.]